MPPQEFTNPYAILGWIVGVGIGVPGLIAIIKGIFFIAKASSKLDQVDRLVQKMDAKDDESNAFAWSFAVVEADINEIQEHLKLAVRAYPDRRVGVPDRRRHD